MLLALVFPNEASVEGHANKMRHQIGETGVMVALDPNHATHFGCGADVRQNYRVVRRPTHALVMQHFCREHDDSVMNNQ